MNVCVGFGSPDAMWAASRSTVGSERWPTSKKCCWSFIAGTSSLKASIAACLTSRPLSAAKRFFFAGNRMKKTSSSGTTWMPDMRDGNGSRGWSDGVVEWWSDGWHYSNTPSLHHSVRSIVPLMVHLVHVQPPAREIIIGGQEERPRWGIVGQHPRLGWLIRVVGSELNLRPGLLGVEYHQGVIDGELGKAHQMCAQGPALLEMGQQLLRHPRLVAPAKGEKDAP